MYASIPRNERANRIASDTTNTPIAATLITILLAGYRLKLYRITLKS